MRLTERQKAYRDYLKSEDWKAKRERKNPKRCAICAKAECLQVHHLVYKNLVDVEMSDLRVLCDTCHATAHKLMNDGKLTFKSKANHNSRFATTKHAVKKELGIGMRNMFHPDKIYPNRAVEKFMAQKLEAEQHLPAWNLSAPWDAEKERIEMKKLYQEKSGDYSY